MRALVAILRVLGAGAVGRCMVDDAEPAAGLQRLAHIFQDIRHVLRQPEEIVQHHERDGAVERIRLEPEIVERLVETHDVGQAVIGQALVDRLAGGALVEPRRVLHVDLPVRSDGAREHLGGVAAGGEQFDDVHSRPHAEELHDLRVVAVVVACAVLGQPLLAVDGGLDCRMNRRRLRGLRYAQRQQCAQYQKTLLSSHRSPLRPRTDGQRVE
jgi:hypothetical protein